MATQAARCPPQLRQLRVDLDALPPSAATTVQPWRRDSTQVEAIILGIYGFFVWLIFIKFKWLPWNITRRSSSRSFRSSA